MKWNALNLRRREKNERNISICVSEFMNMLCNRCLNDKAHQPNSCNNKFMTNLDDVDDDDDGNGINDYTDDDYGNSDVGVCIT